MEIKTSLLIGALSTSLLIGCGGGSGKSSTGSIYQGKSYSGLNSQATLSNDNKDAFADASISIALETGDTSALDLVDVLPLGVEFNSSEFEEFEAESFAKKLMDSIDPDTTFSDYPLGYTEAPIYGSCGGKLQQTYSEEDYSMTVKYDSYCDYTDTDGFTLNGSLLLSISRTSTADVVTTTYNNVKISSDGETAVLSGRLKVELEYRVGANREYEDPIASETTSNLEVIFNGQSKYFNNKVICGSDDSCDLEIYIEGNNGKVYKGKDLSISGGRITGSVYEPDYGYAQLDAINLVACSNSVTGALDISGGTFTITSSGSGVITIEYFSCGGYSVRFDENDIR